MRAHSFACVRAALREYVPANCPIMGPSLVQLQHTSVRGGGGDCSGMRLEDMSHHINCLSCSAHPYKIWGKEVFGAALLIC